MDSHGQTTIPEYTAKTGLDMANFWSDKNGEKVDYGDFLQQMIKCYVLMI